jgi:hypothetical protein
MSKLIDLTGKQYGRLTVLSKAESGDGRTRWNCKCDCGNELIVHGLNLKKGRTKSCGCLNKELTSRRFTSHSMSRTRICKIWYGIIKRCENPKNAAYKFYGGRGISICKEWRDDFMSFYRWSVENGYSDSLSIDRINVNGNYEPGNCRWAVPKEQQNNTTRNHYVTYLGKTKSIAEWADEYSISYSALLQRITKLKWSTKRALETPERGKAGCIL